MKIFNIMMSELPFDPLNRLVILYFCGYILTYVTTDELHDSHYYENYENIYQFKRFWSKNYTRKYFYLLFHVIKIKIKHILKKFVHI